MPTGRCICDLWESRAIVVSQRLIVIEVIEGVRVQEIELFMFYGAVGGSLFRWRVWIRVNRGSNATRSLE